MSPLYPQKDGCRGEAMHKAAFKSPFPVPLPPVGFVLVMVIGEVQPVALIGVEIRGKEEQRVLGIGIPLEEHIFKKPR